MLRNGVCGQSGIIAHQDVVQLAEQQAEKEFHGEMSALPSGFTMGATVSEVLRQAQGARVKKGGWTGGDAW